MTAAGCGMVVEVEEEVEEVEEHASADSAHGGATQMGVDETAEEMIRDSDGVYAIVQGAWELWRGV